MNATILITTSNVIDMNSSTGYTIGAAIALIILAYLLYSLIKPDKF